MEQENNNRVVIVLLIVIIVILLALVILLATGTIKFNNDKMDSKATDNQIIEGNTNTDTIDDNQVSDSTNNGENLQDWVGEYKGTDPWNEKVTVKLTTINESKLEWIFSNNYCEKTVSSDLINNTSSFHIHETCQNNRYEINYGVVLTLKDNTILLKYVDGYMMSIASTGNASFNNVGPLTDSEKTVVLKK